MLTLNETLAMPDADHAWSVINDLSTLVPCVPGASVTSVVSPCWRVATRTKNLEYRDVQVFPSAGGGTRTPDTRIMIPLL